MTLRPLVCDNGQIRQMSGAEYPPASTGSGSAPKARLGRSANISVSFSANTWTEIPFSEVVFSEGGTWWDSANPNRLIIPEAGTYLVGATHRISIGGTGYYEATLTRNGSQNIQHQMWPVTVTFRNYEYSIQTLFQFSQGDLITYRFQVGSATSFTIIATASITPALWAVKL